MKKWFLAFTFAFLLILPGVLAVNLKVNELSQNEVLIPDLGQPVVFDLNITNSGPSDTFRVYNLAGFSMDPSNMTINTGQTKEVALKLTPIGSISQRGYFTIPYAIRGSDGSESNQNATFKIVDMKDALEVGSSDFDPSTESIDIFIKNDVNFDFGNMDVKFSSAFFNMKQSFDMGPMDTKVFSVQLNHADFKSLMAGYYTLKADITTNGKEAVSEGLIKFVEKNIITTTKKDYGFLINTEDIQKTNDGNTIATSETVIKKNVLSRLFTGLSPAPDMVERSGLTVYYTWTRDIKPGETLDIQVKTNWLFPVILIVLIVAVVAIVKRYTGTSLMIRKRVNFVRAKGGEFALKVTIAVKAKHHVERVNLVDRLPAMVKLHERMGGDQPTRVDEKNRRIEWNFDKIEAGEIRMVSYLVYSKVGVVGRFELPTASAIFEREGNIHEVESNKAFFVAEQRAMSED